MSENTMPQLGGELIRDIERLPVSMKTMVLAKKLDAQIDMPVVFWINYPGKFSETARQRGMHNQFLVTVQPQKEQSEFERILLHHMLRGVMQTKRFPTVNGKPSYIQLIEGTHDSYKMWRLCGKINAWVTTAFCHEFFRPYGISTSEATWDRKIDYLKRKTRRIYPLDLRNPETIGYILDLSSVACASPDYLKIVQRIAGKAGTQQYASALKVKIKQTVEIIQKMSKEYTVENASKLMETVFTDVMNVFSLEDKFQIEYHYIMQNDDIPINGIKRIYSYIPDSIEDKAFYTRAIKEINAALVLLQEYLTNFGNGIVADFHVNLADGDEIQAFANGTKENGYFISVTRPMLIKLGEYAQSASVPAEVYDTKLDDEASFRKRLYKCLLIGVFFHEYGHIYNGDCDHPDRLQKEEKEAEADSFALELFRKSCVLQYRFGNSTPDVEMDLLARKVSMDMIAFSLAQECLKELREDFAQSFM